MKSDQFTNKSDLQNARKTTAPWITSPTGSGRPQPRETKESAHQSHPSRAAPEVRKQRASSRAPQQRQPSDASGLGSCKETNKSQSLRRPAPASLQRQDHKPRSAASTIMRRCPAVGCAVRVQRTHKSGIHGQLCSCKQRQAVCHHLEPSVVHQVRNVHVKVPHKQNNGDSATSLAADLRSCSQGQSPVSPALRFDCKLRGSGRPHRQKRRERERGRRRRRSKRTLKSCGSMRVWKLEGVVVNATPAPVPLCDRVKALSASVN